jgi:GDP-D-mannose 3', 5'-epimerase
MQASGKRCRQRTQESQMKKCLVLGSSGFLGQHLEYKLKERGDFVVGVARKYPPYRKSVADETNVLDLTNMAEFHSHFLRHHFDEVFQLAGLVGGLGYIGTGDNDAAILTNSLKINLYTLEAIRHTQACDRIFFASSQCVYPDRFEIDPFIAERVHDPKHREIDASFNTFAFGKEKLYAEALYDAFASNYGLQVRIGRLGNVYGPYSCWAGERAKAPAAICRKVAEAPYAGVVDLWGDGTQSRSFTFVDDAIDGILRLMRSDYNQPVNIAHPGTVTIKELFETTCRVANKILGWQPSEGPTGTAARGSDNTLCRKVLDWEPSTSLSQGLSTTYPWIREQVEKTLTKTLVEGTPI